MEILNMCELKMHYHTTKRSIYQIKENQIEDDMK